MKPKTRTITVRVRWEHIARGKQSKECGCPVALALRPFFPKASVGERAVWTTGRPSSEVKLPAAVGRFVRTFDIHRESAKPFTFKLKVPA